MAKQPKATPQDRLRAENERLRAENERLKSQPGPKTHSHTFGGRFWRKFGAIIFGVLAIALLIAGNLLFWAGNTIVKPDRFKSTVTPIIQQNSVQTAVASYTTNAVFTSVNVQQAVANVLPPRADFLAPTIANSLKGSTEGTLKRVLARPQFQDRWNELLTGAQSKFITSVEKNGGDGVININDLYQQLSNSLKGTKLSFLADRKLPAKYGNVQIVSGSGITALHRVITHIDLWRVLAIILFLLCTALFVYLSRRRRRAVLQLAWFAVAAMFLTLIAVRITREVIAGRVQPQYTQAVRDTAQIVFHPLVVQTATLLLLFLLVAIVGWLTGTYRSATFARSRLQLLFAGKLHHAVFGERENALTRWVGHYKHVLEWATVAIAALLLLITRVTPKALLVYAIITVLVVLVLELIGAPVVLPGEHRETD